MLRSPFLLLHGTGSQRPINEQWIIYLLLQLRQLQGITLPFKQRSLLKTRGLPQLIGVLQRRYTNNHFTQTTVALHVYLCNLACTFRNRIQYPVLINPTVILVRPWFRRQIIGQWSQFIPKLNPAVVFSINRTIAQVNQLLCSAVAPYPDISGLCCRERLWQLDGIAWQHDPHTG